ncbi:hypothetical protein HT576_08990 [Haloterrigena sp. SYSU A121-1]|uniref:Uncharacterized protein n=1 Tax=Haloterrigena gelatinilytica TaxID=2741724 RepID=A0A8J8GL11_9EURY|nr:hypothetical protein [Haloterrigena gelatinilytica]NUB91155.1 hypothetical protein [Haloterrigena gelatinilytica]
MRALKIEDETLSTRNKAKQLMKKAEKQGDDTADFSNVEFAGRAFADEAVKQAELRDIEIIGLSGDVETMFEHVGFLHENGGENDR